MDLKKIYYTADGKKCNILQLVNIEPEWAANIIQKYEEKIKILQNTIDDIAKIKRGIHDYTQK